MGDIAEIFGANLRFLRKKAKLTQKKFADKIGYSEKAISKWESGKAIPPLETIYLITQFFHISIDDMLNKNFNNEETVQ